jgi:hypothetical protein
MEIVVERCAGLDVHKDSVVACVRVPGVSGERETKVVTSPSPRICLPCGTCWYRSG